MDAAQKTWYLFGAICSISRRAPEPPRATRSQPESIHIVFFSITDSNKFLNSGICNCQGNLW